MKRAVLLDTGPLVAFINPRVAMHQWAVSAWATIAKPLLTCEAVISEACFLLQNVYRGEEGIMILLETDIIELPFRLGEEVSAVKTLINRYQSVPMSLADACLARMTEMYTTSDLLTLDSDFRIYRKHSNQMIPVAMPET